MAAGFRSVFLLFGLAAGAAAAPPPPPPPPVGETGATPGRPGSGPGQALTAAQIARLRGWQAPPRREREPEPEERRHRFSTTQLTCRPGDARLVRTAQQLIAAADLDPGEGLEAAPHITIRYGLETDAPGPVATILGAAEPLVVRLGALQVFEPEDEDYDVLVLRIDSDPLRAMNTALREADIPQTDTQAGYVPHLTLGYVRKGLGATYRGLRHDLLGQVFSFTEADFIDRDGVCTTIPLAGRGQERGGTAPDVTGLVTPAPRSGPLAPLLATARALPPLDWAPLLTLAALDRHRRQALQRAAEDEEALVLMLVLLEEL
jgi:hypothetical protein